MRFNVVVNFKVANHLGSWIHRGLHLSNVSILKILVIVHYVYRLYPPGLAHLRLIINRLIILKLWLFFIFLRYLKDKWWFVTAHQIPPYSYLWVFLCACSHFGLIICYEGTFVSFFLTNTWIKRIVVFGVTLYRNRSHSLVHLLKLIQTSKNRSTLNVLLIAFTAIIKNLHSREIIGQFSRLSNGLLLTIW